MAKRRGRTALLTFRVVVIAVAGVGACLHLDAHTSQSVLEHQSAAPDRPTLSDAQGLFYSGRYAAAAALTLKLR